MYFPAAYGEGHGRADIHTAAHAGARGYSLKEDTVHGGPMLEQVYPEGLQPMGMTHVGGEKCEQEGASEGSCYEQAPHSSILMHCLGRVEGSRGVGNEGVKWSLGKTGEKVC